MVIDISMFRSDNEALIALRDTNKPLADTSKGRVYQQREKFNETERAIPDIYDKLTRDPNQLKEF
jgi:hypothetical protein